MDDLKHPLPEGEERILNRRTALKLGAYAAYTAPILIALATSSKAQGTSGVGGCDFTDPDCEFAKPLSSGGKSSGSRGSGGGGRARGGRRGR